RERDPAKKMRTVALVLAAMIGCGAQPVFAQSKAVVLITDEEGKLSAAPSSELSFRAGVSRGPSITVLSPTPSDGNLKSPFRLQLKFEGRGGAQVDPDTL